MGPGWGLLCIAAFGLKRVRVRSVRGEALHYTLIRLPVDIHLVLGVAVLYPLRPVWVLVRLRAVALMTNSSGWRVGMGWVGIGCQGRAG